MVAAIDSVKADLTARIAAIDGRARHVAARDLAVELDAIRVIADRHGLNLAVTVAQFLDWTLSRGERGALLRSWLGMLGEAVVSERQDRDACDSFAAACSVRLAVV